MAATLLHMTHDEYLTHPAVSQSMLKRMAHNPLLFYQQYLSRQVPVPGPTAPMLWGANLEQYLMTGGPPSGYVIVPREVLSASGAKAGKKFNEWKKTQPKDAVLLREEEYQNLFGAFEIVRTNVMEHDFARKLVYPDDKDVKWGTRLEWECPSTGLRRKCEIDLILGWTPVFVDIKTSHDIDAGRFSKHAYDLGYDLQMYTYQEAMTAWTGSSMWIPAILAIRSEPPYDVTVYEPDSDFMSSGADKNERLVREFLRRNDSNDWHKERHGKCESLSIPPWAVK